jgi:hypothetical protein
VTSRVLEEGGGPGVAVLGAVTETEAEADSDTSFLSLVGVDSTASGFANDFLKKSDP